MLNKVRVGNRNDGAEILLRTRFTWECNENQSKDALHMYAENDSAMKRNKTVLNYLSGELYTIEANEP